MLNKIFNRQSRLDHPEPSERIRGLADEDVVAADVARLLKDDPSVDVRKAAVARCTSAQPLVDAISGDADPGVREVAAIQLGSVLAQVSDATAPSSEAAAPSSNSAAASFAPGTIAPADAIRWLADAALPDAVRVETAKRTDSAEVRSAAIAAISAESSLVALALDAGRTETRMAAAERIVGEASLQQLHDQARNKDHGVARLAKQKLDALRNRSAQSTEADAILDALESLANEPGPILTAVVELNRRWQALDMSGDAARRGRAETARQAIQARFDREQDQQRAKAAFDRRLREWTTELASMTLPPVEALTELRTTLGALRDEATARNDAAALERVADAERRIVGWDAEHTALAGAEALVDEAEKLAADTSIDDAQLPSRWQSLDRSTRTPDLTRRFEAALTTIETRRLAQVQATTQQATAAKAQLHSLLHTAEQSLAGGKLHAARTALDEARALKTAAGVLPKPTIQRMSRAQQQLGELERWESFGQQSARMQLIERAEALAGPAADPSHVAQEVQKLRNEWKALDDQYKGVPKALWERFDGACEKAYAPAARHFAEISQQRKDARKRREDYIAQAAAHMPVLLTETPDWKAIDKWVRETEHGWHEQALGSVDPSTWKKLEAKLKDAIAPVRDALSAARAKVKAEREALIAEVNALLPRAMERDTPSQVKTIQQRWQDNARHLALLQRDERQLWDQFRSACDAVFAARNAKRSEEETRKSDSRKALEAVAAQLEDLAKSKDAPEQDVRRALREAQEQWKNLTATPDPAVREVEGRFRRAKTAVDDALSDRSRARESAVWQTLDAKERACEALDRAVRDSADAGAAAIRVDEEWGRLPALPPNWEKALAKRRDTGKRAAEDAAAAEQLRTAITRAQPQRRAMLLELELTLGLESPKDLQAERLALQVQQLKDRFKSSVTATPESAGELFAQWCALPGVTDATDRTRCEKIVAALGSARGRPAPKRDEVPSYDTRSFSRPDRPPGGSSDRPRGGPSNRPPGGPSSRPPGGPSNRPPGGSPGRPPRRG